MGLLDQAKQDIEQITSSTDEWAAVITLTSPDGLSTVTVNGLHTKHNLGFNAETGANVNAKKATIGISERFLKDAAYPVRNGRGEVLLKNHYVDVKDSTGLSKKYVISEAFADETIGFISCILSDRA